jgi:adenylate kinase
VSVIFVAGIHAVGKSTACELVSAEIGIPHYTASQIIRDEKSAVIPAGSKLLDDVAENQRLLIQGISRLSATGTILLDGHFTLRRKSDGAIEAIPVDIFREIQVSAVVVFTDDPVKIAERAFERDKAELSLESLHSHQEAEVKQAKHVATTLGLPIVMLKAFDTQTFANAIRGWEFESPPTTLPSHV